MTPSQPDVAAEQPSLVNKADIHANLRQLERREWWLWSTAVLVMLLLTLGVASFAFPELLQYAEGSYSFYMSQAVRGLVGLVLLFCIYTIYQQLQIHRLRRQMAQQMDTTAKVEVLAEEVYKLAVLDPLTGLYNRRSGEQRLAEEINRSQRYNRPLTTLLLDLDGLKQVNDSYGHAAGDLMLKGFSERLTKAIRGSDQAVRLGGDEFLVILPECRADEVRHVLGRLTGLQVNCNGQMVPTTFSVGWADYRSGETFDELLKRADDALYANKRVGKDQAEPHVARV